MDANENDIPPAAGFRVQGFPTIKFKAAGSSQFVDYEGDRSLESFLEYIETNSVNKVKPNAAPKSSTPASAGEAGKHDELCKFSFAQISSHMKNSADRAACVPYRNAFARQNDWSPAVVCQ
jgi:hypothetical protein